MLHLPRFVRIPALAMLLHCECSSRRQWEAASGHIGADIIVFGASSGGEFSTLLPLSEMRERILGVIVQISPGSTRCLEEPLYQVRERCRGVLVVLTGCRFQRHSSTCAVTRRTQAQLRSRHQCRGWKGVVFPRLRSSAFPSQSIPNSCHACKV